MVSNVQKVTIVGNLIFALVGRPFTNESGASYLVKIDSSELPKSGQKQQIFFTIQFFDAILGGM